MKVVGVETVVVGTPWRELTFVELVTDEGLRGVGEARMVNKTDTLLACIEELAGRYVLGMDPFDVERLAWAAASEAMCTSRARRTSSRSSSWRGSRRTAAVK